MTKHDGRTDSERVAWITSLAGATLVLSTTLIGSGFQTGALGFAAWALLPYGVLLLMARIVRDAFAVGGAGSAVLAAELGIRAAVFVFPRGSTAAVALVFSPALLTAFVLPAGGLAGWIVGRAWRSGGVAMRVFACTVHAIALVGLALSFVRPDLMPGPALRRHAALERIGDPRVVTGADAFSRTLVTDAEGWFQTGSFDAVPGEEIAVIGPRGAVFLDPADFRERGRVSFGAEPGRLWSWYSRLARLDDRLVVVQTGGGYSEAEVLDLDGRSLWRHRPDPELPPSALLPADLDGDGRLEFYVADTDSIARLDAGGREVWRRTARYGAQLVPSRVPGNGSPGWLTVFEPGVALTIWDPGGTLVRRMPAPPEAVTVRIVDWPEQRVLLAGRTTLRGIDAEGAVEFEVPLGDFTFTDALTVRPAPGAAPLLAIAAIAPRDVGRWRIVLLAADRSIVYDEIFDRPASLLVVQRDDGAETLLVAGDGLIAIRP